MKRPVIKLLLSLILVPGAFAAEIQGVRMWHSETGTNVVFDLNQPLRYHVYTLDNPYRLVVDFSATSVRTSLNLPPVDGTPLSRLRYAPKGTDDLRVVLDTSERLEVDDILLPASGKYGDRLLLRLASAGGAAVPVRATEPPLQTLAPVTPQAVAGTPVDAPAALPTLRERVGSISDRIAGWFNKPRPKPVRLRRYDTRFKRGAPASPANDPNANPRPVVMEENPDVEIIRSAPPAPSTPAPVVAAPAIAEPVAVPTQPVVESSKPHVAAKQSRGAGDNIAWEISGFYSAEARVFLHDAQYPRQHEANASFAIQPELYIEWDSGDQSLLVVPFARWDQGDPRRTHFDLRELSYIHSSEIFEFRAGVRKVFWGVAESNHLVDVINQFDVVENIDLEDKLGQPMLNVALIQDWGTVDVFALLGFRERTFPGVKGRLRSNPRIQTSSATYDSTAEDNHVDWAIRYAKPIGDFDIGLYHFWGTNREPRLAPTLTSSNELVLTPHYDLIHQTGADIQATKGNWLYKFEGLRRSGHGETFYAMVGGFEYTFVGIFETAMDLGVLGEYHFDDRHKDATTPFNNDLFTGSRLAFNDVQDSAILAGISADLDGRSKFFNVEASRRLAGNWKVEAELRVFWDVDPTDPLYFIRRDDYLQVELARYF